MFIIQLYSHLHGIIRKGDENMNHTVGKIIKIERLHKNMKQITLAKGICSTSYLSRIENNVIIPDQEIIDLLLNKLDIKMKVISLSEEEFLIAELYDLYKASIIERDKDNIRNVLNKLPVEKINFVNLTNYYSYNLYILRLYLIIGNNEKASTLLNILSAVVEEFDDKHKFIFHLNSGLYYYLNGDYYNATSTLEIALMISERIVLPDWEIADFRNAISLAYLNTDLNYKALQYSVLALNYFKDNLLFERSVDSYMVMGIAHTELGEYKKAEGNFSLALRLLTDKDNAKVGTIHQNLGYLYAISGNNEKALNSYMLSLSFKEQTDNLVSKLRTILSIIKEYSKLDDSKKVLEWCETGKLLIGSNVTSNLAYWFHFDIFESIYSNSLELEMKITNAINFFEMENDERHVQKYSIVLGNYFYDNKKYKMSSLFLKKSNSILLKQRNLLNWEDL